MTPKNVIQGLVCIFTRDTPLPERLHWILRFSSALCFIGHGAWGIIKKAGWLPFYDIFGIPPDIAYATMPIVGALDITLGVAILIVPLRAVLFYMVFWALFTAMLRPMAGMGWWEFLERAGNYGAPLALLYLGGSGYRPGTMVFYLRVFTALLLIGHGGYGAFHQKAMLVSHLAAVHVPPAQMIDGLTFIRYFGLFEILLGVLVFFKPHPRLCLFVVFWKLATEFLYVIHGPVAWEIFEFIERWGSYGVPLALYFLLERDRVAQGSSIIQGEVTDETLPRRAFLQH